MGDNPRQPALILLSGMAADASVFAPQAVAFPDLIVPEWIEPWWGEQLTDYCTRLAETLDVPAGAVLGGASFGGVIALGLAAHLRPQSIILIGSVRSPNELPTWIRLLRPLAPLVRWAPVRPIQFALRPLASRWAAKRLPHLAGVCRQFCRASPRLLRWSIRELLHWRGAPVVECPVYRIHGDRDRVLPLGRAEADCLIAGGGHVISLTHASEVNAAIRAVCRTGVADQVFRNPNS